MLRDRLLVSALLFISPLCFAQDPPANSQRALGESRGLGKLSLPVKRDGL